MERTTLEEYVNGPYEERPIFQSSGLITSTSEAVALRLYRDAFVVLRRAGRYTKYLLDANSTVNAESYRSDEFSVRCATGDVFLRVAGTDKRDTWVWYIMQRLTELQSEGDRSARAAAVPTAASEFKIAPLLPPSNAIGTDVSSDVSSPRRGVEHDARAVLRRGGIVVATFVLFACIYVGACRSRYAAAAINIPVWMFVHPELYVLPWALTGSKTATSLFVGGLVGLNIAITIWVRFLHDVRHQVYPDHEFVWWAVVRSLLTGFLARSLACVIFLMAYYRGAVPKGRLLMGRRGRCQFEVSRAQVVMVVTNMMQGVSDDILSIVLNFAPAYVQGTTIYFFCCLFINLTLMYMTRHKMQEYWWLPLQQYSPLIVWATYLLGRAALIVVGLARANIHTLNFDLVLAALFVVYKLMFVLLYPYTLYITLRMGAREHQMKWVFAVQVIDAVVLDAFAILSPTISSTYIIFMAMRVVFAVVYQAGLLRKVTDRMGVTTPAWYDLQPDARPTKLSSFLATLFPSSTSSELHMTEEEPTMVDMGTTVPTTVAGSAPNSAREGTPRGSAGTATDNGDAASTVSANSNRNSPRLRPVRIPGLTSSPRQSAAPIVGATTEGGAEAAVIMFPRESPGRGTAKRSISGSSGGKTKTSSVSVGSKAPAVVPLRQASKGSESSMNEESSERTITEPAPDSAASDVTANVLKNVGELAGPERMGSSLSQHELLRETFGDSPLARWLFFVQSVLAGLMSSLGLIAVAAVDKVLPGFCIMTCGMPLSIIELRAGISLVTWLVTLGLTFAIAYINMRRYGFTKEELAQLTSRHLRQSLPILLTIGLPVACYIMDYVGGYAQEILGRVPNPLTVPLYNQ